MPASSLDRRLFVVLLAGGMIAALCVWRVSTNRPVDYTETGGGPAMWRRAPGFEASDAHNQMFRLERYLGRHQVLVVFVPGEAEPIQETLRLLNDHRERLGRLDIKVVVLSPALPQQHREWLGDGGGSSFPILTDLQGEIAREWGLLKIKSPEAFLVDRKGDVRWAGIAPLPAGDLPDVLNELQSDKEIP